GRALLPEGHEDHHVGVAMVREGLRGGSAAARPERDREAGPAQKPHLPRSPSPSMDADSARPSSGCDLALAVSAARSLARSPAAPADAHMAAPIASSDEAISLAPPSRAPASVSAASRCAAIPSARDHPVASAGQTPGSI